MKKVFFVLLLAAVVAGGAFAQQGFGIGAFGTVGGSFSSSAVGYGGALSLKAPTMPMYWGLSFGASDNYLRIGVIADYPIVRGTLVPNAGLGWYVHGGVYGRFVTASKYSALGFGARLPIGLNLRPPSVRFLEVFLAVVPTIGAYTGNFGDGNFGFESGWSTELGFRIWLSYL